MFFVSFLCFLCWRFDNRYVYTQRYDLTECMTYIFTYEDIIFQARGNVALLILSRYSLLKTGCNDDVSNPQSGVIMPNIDYQKQCCSDKLLDKFLYSARVFLCHLFEWFNDWTNLGNIVENAEWEWPKIYSTYKNSTWFQTCEVPMST